MWRACYMSIFAARPAKASGWPAARAATGECAGERCQGHGVGEPGEGSRWAVMVRCLPSGLSLGTWGYDRGLLGARLSACAGPAGVVAGAVIWLAAGGRWRSRRTAGGGGGAAGEDQGGKQAGPPAGAERGPADGRADEEAGGEGQGAEPVVAAGGAGGGGGVDDGWERRR